MLSTLHTNDAAGTVHRLVNMGIEPYLVAGAVGLVCAQRLVRRVCTRCVEEEPTPVPALHAIGFEADEAARVVPRRGAGCDRCDGSGYRGRIGLYEVMAATDRFRRVRRGASAADLRRDAVEGGGSRCGEGPAGRVGRRPPRDAVEGGMVRCGQGREREKERSEEDRGLPPSKRSSRRR